MSAAHAAAPSTSCPTGYIAIMEPDIVLAASSCPSGMIKVGTAESCLVTSPAGECMMFVPSGMSYTDVAGTYQYKDICPLI